MTHWNKNFISCSALALAMMMSPGAHALLTQEGLHGLMRVTGAPPIEQGLFDVGTSLEISTISFVFVHPVTGKVTKLSSTSTNLRFIGSYGITDQIEVGTYIPIVDGGAKMGIGDIGIRGKYVSSLNSDFNLGGLLGFDLPTGGLGFGAGFNVHLGGVMTWSVPDKPVRVHGELRYVITGSVDLGLPAPFDIKIPVPNYLQLGGGASYLLNDRFILSSEMGINGFGSGSGFFGVGGTFAATDSIDTGAKIALGLGPNSPNFNFLLFGNYRFGNIGFENTGFVEFKFDEDAPKKKVRKAPKKAKPKPRQSAKTRSAKKPRQTATKGELTKVVALLKAKNPDKALKTLKVLKRKYPRDPRIPYYTGAAYLSKKDRKKAWNSFVEARNLAPKGSKIREKSQEKINQLSKT